MAVPVTYPKFSSYDSGGIERSGFRLITTSEVALVGVVLPTFSDSALSVLNPNPVVLDANGEAWVFPLPAEYGLNFRTTDPPNSSIWSVARYGVDQFGVNITHRNLLGNGGFECWQPGTSFTMPASNTTVFVADNWMARVSLAAGAATDFVLSRQPSQRDGSQYSVRFQRTAASTSTGQPQIAQTIETLDAVAAQGQVVTLSLWIRTGADWSGSLAASVWYGTGADDSFFIGFPNVTQLSGTSAIVAPLTEWTQFTATMLAPATVPSFATELAVWVLASMNSASPAGADDWFEIDDVQLEVGSMTAFEREPFSTTLERVQRRYYKSFPYSVAPVQNSGVNGHVVAQAVGAAGAMVSDSLPMPTHMRDVTGTLTLFNPSAANAQVRNITAGVDCTVSTGVITPNEAHVTFTSAAGSAAGNKNMIHYTIDRRF